MVDGQDGLLPKCLWSKWATSLNGQPNFRSSHCYFDIFPEMDDMFVCCHGHGISPLVWVKMTITNGPMHMHLQCEAAIGSEELDALSSVSVSGKGSSTA